MPNTNPDHWFLPASEMPRTPHYTSDNKVIALTEGETYFSHLSARLAAMKGGYVHIAGFRVTPSIPLLPATSPPGPLLVDQLTDLVARGVTVRLAVWYLPTALFTFFYRLLPIRRFNHHKDNVDIVKAINDAAAKAGTKSAAILDQRLVFPFPYAPTTLASHHQKTVIIRSESHDWAYVGSIDLAVDRWDTSVHASPPSRPKEYWEAYHDIHCVVRGAAVAQIWENFRQRWNDTTPPAKPPSPLPIVVPPAITDPPPATASYGTHYVQVLRTLACRGVYPFAPNGEQTARKALERAIERAEHYIYIEEQFLWPCSVIDSLHKVVKRNSALKVIIVLAEELEFGIPLRVVHHEMRNEAISAVIGTSIGQVFVYCLEQLSTKNPIYVHSKLTLIDDCFVAVGSVNINKRSLTTDAELHMGIVDADIIPSTMNGIPVSVCRFAKELRVALWAEHLGITDMTKLEDPVAALLLWPDWSKSIPRAPSRVHHALCYHPRSETASLLEWLEIMRALRTVLPSLPPPWNKLIDLDNAIDLAESLEKIGVSSPVILLEPFFLWLKRLLRDFIMNIETTC
jgi:phosphatidylserine/phosphatidylglycerophosphate/cardiolipin synthase-like enzyme